MPSDHGHVLARFHNATEETVQAAIQSCSQAKDDWANMPFAERAAIFRKVQQPSHSFILQDVYIIIFKVDKSNDLIYMFM